MTITLNIPNKQLFEKILWLLSRFKSDGVEIIVNKEKPEIIRKNSLKLEQFKKIISTKSKNSIKIDQHTILNPYDELSNDKGFKRFNDICDIKIEVLSP